MSNEEIVDEILHEAAALKVREEVIDSANNLLEKNPMMEKVDAYDLALKNIKLHAGITK
jgi:hypothetical protein